MNEDPYRVLGISSSATDDEVKSAYRKLAKKYHPDVNGGSATAETMMKKVNEAYTEILKIRRGGNSSYGAGGSSSGYNHTGGTYSGNANGNRYGNGYGSSGFSGFDGFGFGSSYGGFGSGGYSNHTGESPEIQAARNYIAFGRYQEAIAVLSRINRQDAQWHFLYARAQLGLGNSVSAMQHARQAADMDPMNMEYRSFVQEMEGGGREYQRYARGFGDISKGICQNPCLALCLANILCNCCCNGAGGYGRFGGF